MKPKSSYILLFLLLLEVISCAHQKKILETNPKLDLYWSQLVEESSENNKSILNVIQEKNPELHNQIIKDAKDEALVNFWGQSLNFDSGAKQKIIDDKIIKDLHLQFGLITDGQVVNAGVTHSYGYLFSVLDTPYGFKRKRWIDPTLNFAFSLTENSLSPETRTGGLLSNLTYFAGTIAFKALKDREQLKKLKNVSNEICNFNYSNLAVDRVEEEFSNIVLRTTLVSLPLKAPNEENDYLLIYSVLNKNLKKEVLITAFPIKKDAYLKITAVDSLGEGQVVSIRYNAYLNGFMNQNLIGKKKLTRER